MYGYSRYAVDSLYRGMWYWAWTVKICGAYPQPSIGSTKYNWINKARCLLTRPNGNPAFHPLAQFSTEANSSTIHPPNTVGTERKCRTHQSIILQTPTTTLTTHITPILSTTLIRSIMTLCGTSIPVRQTRDLKFWHGCLHLSLAFDIKTSEPAVLIMLGDGCCKPMNFKGGVMRVNMRHYFAMAIRQSVKPILGERKSSKKY